MSLLAPGARLGTYEILGALGAGGGVEVYRARDLRLGREIAVKILPETLAASPDRLAEFEREARIVASLKHANIVMLYSVEDDVGRHFLTMEMVEGKALDAYVTREGLSLRLLLDLAIPIADALAAAHRRGVVHGELRPGNVTVTKDGRPVLDFGIARTAGATAGAVPPRDLAETMAAPAADAAADASAPYRAPEQVRGAPAAPAADIFSLGIVLYEMAAGQRPFTGTTPEDVGASILRDTPPALRSFRGDLPEALERVVHRCLDKDPLGRFASADDLGVELKALKLAYDRTAPQPEAPQAVRSVAVLPFVNRSHDDEDVYFSDGLADELIDTLAKIRGLRVAARTSAFRFRDRAEGLEEIGRKLNVGAILDGSVRRAAGRVRISVQLVSVADGFTLWSEGYDRTLDDVLAVQTDIAQSVVKGLRSNLAGAVAPAADDVRAEVARAARGRAKHPEAHRLYLQARYIMGRYNREDTAKTIDYLKRATDLDPGFALAWADLGRAYTREAGFGWVPREEGGQRARAALGRALTLEPDLAEAHGYLGWLQMREWNWPDAEASYRRALDLAPDSARSLNGMGGLLSNFDRIEEAIECYLRVLELDPIDALAHLNLSHMFLGLGRFRDAEAACRKALALAPESHFTRCILGLVLSAQGQGEEALNEASREPDECLRIWSLAIIHHAMGHGAKSDEYLQELIQKYAEDSAFQVAEVYGARGEVDAAFEWLDRGFSQRDAGLSAVRYSPRLRCLHGDPRWVPFLRKMGFVDEGVEGKRLGASRPVLG